MPFHFEIAIVYKSMLFLQYRSQKVKSFTSHFRQVLLQLHFKCGIQARNSWRICKTNRDMEEYSNWK